MTSYDRGFAKNRAFQLGGRNVWFSETKGGQKKLGRVVGYYFSMAQVVLECDSDVEYPIDPLMTHLQPVVQLRQGPQFQYVCVDVYLIDAELRTKTSRYPHNCNRCGSPAFTLFRTIECSNFSCVHYKL